MGTQNNGFLIFLWAQIHFLGDVFAAIAIVVASAPNIYCFLRAPDSLLPLTNNRPHHKGLCLQLFSKGNVGFFYVPFKLMSKEGRVEANSLTPPVPISTETD